MVVTLSNGVKLEVKAVPSFVIKRIQDQLSPERPVVPTVYLKDQDRTIEVPENPDYQRTLLEYEGKVVEAIYDAAIILGTKPLEVPEGVQKITDTEWADDLNLVGVTVPVDGKARYLAWVKFYACQVTTDMQTILAAINKSIGVTEAEAAKAADLFRNST